jgi:NCAIR mutase (PurE)-related protein
MEDLLRKVKDGRISVEEAKEEIEKRLFGGDIANIDTGRGHRTGVPEVILAEGKTDEQVLAITIEFIDRAGKAIISRLDEKRSTGFISQLKNKTDVDVVYESLPGFLVVSKKGHKTKVSGGKVAVITAGTSDIARAMEAELMAKEMGCEVIHFYDIGVAGLHRFLKPLEEIHLWEADAIIVAAGREGALPTLISGITSIPVIGLPISTGYGLHGNGETALFAMLQSCSPIAVVNIDAGFVAGAIAGKIANARAK